MTAAPVIPAPIAELLRTYGDAEYAFGLAGSDAFERHRAARDKTLADLVEEIARTTEPAQPQAAAGVPTSKLEPSGGEMPEPTAYIVRDARGYTIALEQDTLGARHHANRHGRPIEPLYLHPPAASAPSGQGVTDADVERAVRVLEDQSPFPTPLSAHRHLRAVLEADRARISAPPRDVVAERQWQPFETAPKDGTLILVYSTSRNGMLLAYFAVDDDCWCEGTTGRELRLNHEYDDRRPTHWMPLTEAACAVPTREPRYGWQAKSGVPWSYETHGFHIHNDLFDWPLNPASRQSAPRPDGASVEGPRAWTDVLAERRRQVAVEGFTAEHDDTHDDGQLALAACCYAMPEYQQGIRTAAHPMSPQPTILKRLWPWDPEWWKPSGARRNLVKAGALILAEIERLDRAELALAFQAEPADGQRGEGSGL